MSQISIVHSTIDAANYAAFMNDMKTVAMDESYGLDMNDYMELSKFGIGGLEKLVQSGMGMDSIQQDVTSPSIGVPVQLVQNWLSGFVMILTAKRKIDDIVGISTVGAWSDEQIVQGIMENTGAAVPYADITNIPLSSYNTNFVTRTVIRFELGMQVGALEQARQAAMRVSADGVKRDSAALNLEVARNRTGFYGYNSGDNNTYGFLNDPQLPAYVTVASGTGGLTWVTKTAEEICADILTAVGALVTNSKGQIDPDSQETTLTLPISRVQYLNKVNTYGLTAKAWLNKTYPKMRIVSAPELDNANGGSNVFYLFADSVNDTSSDDKRTFIQVVPAKFQVLGVQQIPKGYIEDYTNATAGVMCKRPFAVYRGSGI
jgi:hypothetical protein